MAKLEIPKTIIDPTLEAIDRAIEIVAALEEARPYLGASAIGDECSRRLWYGFRWADKWLKPAFLIKCGERGHRGEDLQAKRLRMVQGVELFTDDPATGKQMGFVDVDGHFKGHWDGKIIGILQAPKTIHIWEHKEKEEKFFQELEKIKDIHGEKEALKRWDYTYYAQAVIYMHYSGLKRHYLTCSTPGGRCTVSIRTDADPVAAAMLIEKARRIIYADTPPARIAKDETYFTCKHLCEKKDICWNEKMPEVNCRTCLHSTPVKDGQWHCAKFDIIIPEENQRVGCASHLFMPTLIHGEPIEAGENYVTYKMKNGTTYTNKGE